MLNYIFCKKKVLTDTQNMHREFEIGFDRTSNKENPTQSRFHRRFLSRNSMQFLSRLICNQLRFYCDCSAVCQCKTSVHVYFLKKLCAYSKVKLLLKVTVFRELHLTETAAINCTKTALKSQLVYTRDLEVTISARQNYIKLRHSVTIPSC